jgi:hypothetical protein
VHPSGVAPEDYGPWWPPRESSAAATGIGTVSTTTRTSAHGAIDEHWLGQGSRMLRKRHPTHHRMDAATHGDAPHDGSGDKEH